MRILSIWSAAGLALGVIASAVSASGQAQPPANELKTGDTAPAFSLPGSDGKVHNLSDYKGKTVVLAWFPKAFTGG
jgi:peroxiredoxin Q/BCP